MCSSIATRVFQCQQEMNCLSSDLPSTRCLTEPTVRQLKRAMETIYVLAVFIQGDYDDRIHDTDVTNAQRTLTKRILTEFEKLQTIAEEALTKVAMSHAKV